MVTRRLRDKLDTFRTRRSAKLHVATPNEWLIIIGFLGAVISVYGSAIFILARLLLLPRARRVPVGFVGWLVLIAAAFGIVCMSYAAFVEPYSLEVTNINLPLPNIKTPCTILQISDLHCDPTPRLENRLLSEITTLKPDVVVFTGDAVNSPQALPQFKAFAQKLCRIAPVYAVIGDWDFAINWNDVFADTGFTLLRGKASIVDIRGNRLCLIGVDSGASCLDVIKTAPHITPTILLFHNPDGDVILQKETAGIDLYLCGHTHGGQIALPVYGALITQSIQGKKYESGLHKLNDMYIYTNRGIGMEGHFPRLRFFAKPEITVFHLLPK